MGSAGTILRTTNGGENWIPQYSGTNHFLSSVFFTDANTGTVVGGGGWPWFPEGTILRTTDGGVTWTAQSSGTTDILRGVAFTDANTGTAVGGWGTVHTTDGGTTWTQQYVESGGSSVFFTDANTGTIVGGGGTILRTTNGGATWTLPQSSGTTQHLESVFFTAQTPARQ